MSRRPAVSVVRSSLRELEEVIEWLVEDGQMTPFAADVIRQHIRKVID